MTSDQQRRKKKKKNRIKRRLAVCEASDREGSSDSKQSLEQTGREERKKSVLHIPISVRD
jgi:hypothetical protein